MNGWEEKIKEEKESSIARNHYYNSSCLVISFLLLIKILAIIAVISCNYQIIRCN